MEKTSNVKKDKNAKESADQRQESTVSETASHEHSLPGSNLTVSTAKSVVKIAAISRATPLEENHTMSNPFGTTKNAPSLATISFGAISIIII